LIEGTAATRTARTPRRLPECPAAGRRPRGGRRGWGAPDRPGVGHSGGDAGRAGTRCRVPPAPARATKPPCRLPGPLQPARDFQCGAVGCFLQSGRRNSCIAFS